MSADFAPFVQGNTRPYFAVQILSLIDRTPVDLTSATVAFYFRHVDSTSAVVSGASCVITDAANGKVQYQWAVNDLATPGTYIAEFRITFSDTTVQSVILTDIEVLEKLG